MDFDKFLLNQKKLYEDISNEIVDVQKLGVEPSPRMFNGEEGIMVALKYPKIFSEKLVNISEKINGLSPSIIYDETNLHTTVTSIGTNIDQSNNEVRIVIQKALHTVIKTINLRIRIVFFKWLLTRESLILAGIPNKDFYILAESIINYCAKEGVCLKYPKMSHITVARFTKVQSAVKVEKLIDFVQKIKLFGEIYPEKIYVGSFNNSAKGIIVDKYKEYSVK
jgi:2'-5' RNA ligase